MRPVLEDYEGGSVDVSADGQSSGDARGDEEVDIEGDKHDEIHDAVLVSHVSLRVIEALRNHPCELEAAPQKRWEVCDGKRLLCVQVRSDYTELVESGSTYSDGCGRAGEIW